MNWNLIDIFRDASRRGFVALLAVAVVAGVGAGYWLSRPGGSANGKPSSPIQWHKVQAVPTRTPDAEDVAWQERSTALDTAAMAAASNAGNADAAVLENKDQ